MKNVGFKLSIYQKELEAIGKEFQSLPAGRLAKRGKFYYHEIDGKRSGITKDIEFIRSLCRKKYLSEQKKRLNNKIYTISRHAKHLEDTSSKEIIQSFSGVYEKIPEDYFYHPSIEDWVKQPYHKNPYLSENRSYTSNNGVALRSKSELLIANLLESYNIPYRYDAEIKLANKKIYPDFIIKKPFTGEIILWEHFGALHQPDYEKKMNEKMDLYLKNDYIPFEKLIYTFEFDIRNIQRLKDLIENIIL